MKCVICKTGDIHPGLTVVNLNREGSTVIIKNVPADVCDNCGEYYLSEDMTKKVLEIGEGAFNSTLAFF